MQRSPLVAGLVLALSAVIPGGWTNQSAPQEPTAVAPPSATAGPSLDAALRAFYNAQYGAAADMTRALCVETLEAVAACEVHTTAILFQIRRAMGDGKDRNAAWKQCATCPALMAAFDVALARGQAAARARLKTTPLDDETLFLLGKLDLNYVWLRLGTLGKRTGWGEYWEARKSLDTVLTRQPGHIRARVARGWIDYIVDTKVRFGAKWLLGGGNKKRGLQTIADAAAVDAGFFPQTEARFALWDMQVRERDVVNARDTAQLLLLDFPDNIELKTFVATSSQTSHR